MNVLQKNYFDKISNLTDTYMEKICEGSYDNCYQRKKGKWMQMSDKCLLEIKP